MNRTDSTAGARALGDAIAGLVNTPARRAASFANSIGRSTSAESCGCEIPPPCWLPRPAGTCRLTIPPGYPGTIRVHVTNCEWSRRVYAITALGKLAGWMTFQPTTIVLDPHERATFLVTVRVPDKTQPGAILSAPLIIRGCLDHFARIEVTVADCAATACCDVTIHDCQDHVHHWYDHFYCARPCNPTSIRDSRNG